MLFFHFLLNVTTFQLIALLYFTELDAYSAVVTAFRAQGDMNKYVNMFLLFFDHGKVAPFELLTDAYTYSYHIIRIDQ